jgi:hypothetical protein
MDREHNDFVIQKAEVNRVRKTLQDCSSYLTVDSWISEWMPQYSRNHLVHCGPELRAQAFGSGFVPLAYLEQLLFSLRSKNRAWDQSRPKSFRRTSDQGTEESGFARCSDQRCSSSARCSSVSPNSTSRSASVRLSQSAIASSARSPGESFRSSASVLECMARSSHAPPPGGNSESRSSCLRDGRLGALVRHRIYETDHSAAGGRWTSRSGRLQCGLTPARRPVRLPPPCRRSAMPKIYPEVWDRRREEDRENLFNSIAALRELVDILVSRGYGLMVTIT